LRLLPLPTPLGSPHCISDGPSVVLSANADQSGRARRVDARRSQARTSIRTMYPP
jgi:hypothetical protein